MSIDTPSLLHFSCSFCSMYSLVFGYWTIIFHNSKSIFALRFSIFFQLTSALVVTLRSVSVVSLITFLLIKWCALLIDIMMNRDS